MTGHEGGCIFNFGRSKVSDQGQNVEDQAASETEERRRGAAED